MMVTEIQEISSSRVKVSTDTGEEFTLYKGELRRYGLKAGDELSPEFCEEFLGKVLVKRARLRCLNLLKSRDYTAAQMKRKLLQGGYSEKTAEEAVAYAASFSYIDDLRYAQNFIHYNQERKSRKRIDSDLSARGVSREILEEAWRRWEEEGNRQDEEVLIEALLAKKHFQAASADDGERRRMYGFLLRKGFSSENFRKFLFP